MLVLSFSKVVVSCLISTFKGTIEICAQAINEKDELSEEALGDSQGLDEKLRRQLKQLRDVKKMNVVRFVDEYEALVNQCIRDDLEEEKDTERLVKKVVNQTREAIRYTEDVVDTYLVNVKKRNRRNRRPKLVNMFHRWRNLHEVNKKMRVINDLIRENNNFFKKMNQEETYTKSSSEPRARERLEEDDEVVVGLDNDKEMLLGRLLGDSVDLQVVSITGMGGSGKTTLAKKIYDDPRIKERFDCCAWVYVSQDYKREDIVRETLSRLKLISDEDSGLHEDDQLKVSSSRYKRNHRFLLVLDDICCTNLWDETRHTLPNDSNGSRILITTRNSKFALYASGGSLTFSIPSLNEEESWRLFTMKVFQGDKIPPELEGPGREIVQHCRGLPISVAAVAALAASKEKNLETWSNLAQNLDSQLTHEERDMLHVLATSYKKLPRRLELCFLYMAAYPKGFEIPVRQLIQLWMAEGFVQYTEEDGEDCLAELIDENLIQVSSRRTDGGVKTCRVHDMLMLTSLSEGNNDKFLHVCTDVNIFSMTKPRRLFLHCSPSLYISSNPPHALSVRSLLCFAHDMHPLERRHWKWLQSRFSLIRVLSLSELKIKAIPSSIGDLILLKYLKLAGEELEVIPSSIGKILCLQTLDLRFSSVNALPVEIWKQKELRHVYVPGPMPLPHPLLWKDYSYPRNLQDLSMATLDENAEKWFRKGLFDNIRKLGLWYKPNSKCNPSQVLAYLSSLNHLRTLKISGTSDLPRSSQSFPRNLTKITLREIEYLPSRTIRALEDLPQLRILKLVGSENSSDMKKFAVNCNANGFAQLQVLKIFSLYIQEWNLWEGAMPKLQNLVIKDCPHLTVLPYRLWGLTCINQIQLSSASTDLERNLHKLQLKDESYKFLFQKDWQEDSLLITRC